MAEKKLTIGLLWHSLNSDNLGVGALTMAHIAILDDIAAELGVELTYHVLGWKDTRPLYTNDARIRMVALRTRDFAKPFGGFMARVKACDVILDIGAGDSFTDIYGLSRSSKILMSKIEVLATGRPLVLSPQTIGPFNRPIIRAIARRVMDRARMVVTRDQLSTNFLTQEMGFSGDWCQATDVAIRLPFEQMAKSQDKTRVGINVSGLLMSGGYSHDNQFGLTVDYPALIDRIIGFFQSQENVEIHLVGHVQSETQLVEDDHRANLKLAEKHDGLVVSPVFADPSEAKSYISGLDFFMGARMHACIGAFSSGVVVVPMAYSRKFAGFFGTLGYDQLTDLKAQTEDEVMARIEAAWIARHDLAAPMAAALAEGRKRLATYEDVLRTELGALRDKG